MSKARGSGKILCPNNQHPSRHTMGVTDAGHKACVVCGTLSRDGVPLAVRFWDKVQKTDDCWIWTGARKGDGYGVMGWKGSNGTPRANRISWELHYGPIPHGQVVAHRCDNPPCVRPDHLFLTDMKGNIRDMVQKGRKPNTMALEMVAEVRRLAQQGMRNKDIAEYLHLRYDAVARVTSGRSWSYVE